MYEFIYAMKNFVDFREIKDLDLVVDFYKENCEKKLTDMQGEYDEMQNSKILGYYEHDQLLGVAIYEFLDRKVLVKDIAVVTEFKDQGIEDEIKLYLARLNEN
jgi:hypothetical protein